MKQIIIFLLACIAIAAYGAIYVNQNSNGNIEYTDTPTNNSQKVDVPAVNTTGRASPAPTSQTRPANNASTAVAAAQSSPNAYTSFEIVSPKAEETIQNQQVVAVQLKVEPNLNEGDKIQLILDNQPAGTPTPTMYQELPNVPRGTHTLSAEIINSQNQVIKQTATITIYIHLNSTITSPAMQPPPPLPKAN